MDFSLAVPTNHVSQCLKISLREREGDRDRDFNEGKKKLVGPLYEANPNFHISFNQTQKSLEFKGQSWLQFMKDGSLVKRYACSKDRQG